MATYSIIIYLMQTTGGMFLAVIVQTQFLFISNFIYSKSCDGHSLLDKHSYQHFIKYGFSAYVYHSIFEHTHAGYMDILDHLNRTNFII